MTILTLNVKAVVYLETPVFNSRQDVTQQKTGIFVCPELRSVRYIQVPMRQ